MDALTGVKVGDTLILCAQFSHNAQPPKLVKVHKVGRKLLYVCKYENKPEYGTDAYRIETGEKNDNYRHAWLIRPEEFARRQRVEALQAALSLRGVDVHQGGEATLRALLDVLDGKTYKSGYSDGYDAAQQDAGDGVLG